MQGGGSVAVLGPEAQDKSNGPSHLSQAESPISFEPFEVTGGTVQRLRKKQMGLNQDAFIYLRRLQSRVEFLILRSATVCYQH